MQEYPIHYPKFFKKEVKRLLSEKIKLKYPKMDKAEITYLADATFRRLPKKFREEMTDHYLTRFKYYEDLAENFERIFRKGTYEERITKHKLSLEEITPKHLY